MTPSGIVAENFVRLFRSGSAFTVPSAGTAGQESKPGATDPAWIDIGGIVDLEPEPKFEEKELRVPAVQGGKVLKKVVEVNRELNISFTAKELSFLGIELIFGAQALNSASTTFNPLGGYAKEFWVQILQKTETGILYNTVDVYCYVKAKGGVKHDGGFVDVPIMCRTLNSSLNVGAISV